MIVFAGLVALFFYALLLFGIHDFAIVDPTLGNSLAVAFAYACAFLMWMAIGLMIFLTDRRTGLPRWLEFATVMLWLAAIGTSFYGIWALSVARGEESWLVIALPTLPLLVAALTPWLLASRGVARRAGAKAIAAATCAVILAVIILSALWGPVEAERNAEADREVKAIREQESARLEADHTRLRAAGPDARVDDLLPYMGQWEEEALAAIRNARGRQADTERLIADRRLPIGTFSRLQGFGVQATPALCAAYGARPEWRDLGTMQYEVDTIRWLQSQGCDLRRQIEGLRTQFRAGALHGYGNFNEGTVNELLAAAPAR